MYVNSNWTSKQRLQAASHGASDDELYNVNVATVRCPVAVSWPAGLSRACMGPVAFGVELFALALALALRAALRRGFPFALSFAFALAMLSPFLFVSEANSFGRP